jgi:hypothetical protein
VKRLTDTLVRREGAGVASAPSDDADDSARDVIVPPPRGRARRAIPWLGVAWVAVHLAVPLRYYSGSDRYDERFAWRMFSAIRVQRCDLEVRQTRDTRTTPLALMQILPAPWVALLERNRTAVLERFLEWRCRDDEGSTSVEIVNRCIAADGEPVPARIATIDCASSAISYRTEPPEPSR